MFLPHHNKTYKSFDRVKLFNGKCHLRKGEVCAFDVSPFLFLFTLAEHSFFKSDEFSQTKIPL